MFKLKIEIKLDMEKNTFECTSNLKPEALKEIVDSVLFAHMGAGSDDSEHCEKDIYTIFIYWDIRDDSFVIKSDTGNKNLTDGILMGFRRTLP